MKKIMLIVVAASIALSGLSLAAEKKQTGAELLATRCSVCHTDNRPKGAKKTVEQWEATVTRMMGKGAKLTAEEKKTLIDYLEKNFKP